MTLVNISLLWKRLGYILVSTTARTDFLIEPDWTKLKEYDALRHALTS